MANSTLFTVSGLAKSFGPTQIFKDVSFHVSDREHVALVGVNGSGKSTLLRSIAGEETPTAGEIALARGARVAYLPQEARFDSPRSVREEARLAFESALQAGERMRQIEHGLSHASGSALEALLEEYDRLSLHFETAGGYDVEHRTEQVLMGLGFSGEQIDQPVRHLSGGQRTRVALAKSLLADPDLLLLDEPTNHLDLTMLDWLEEFLRSWPGTCLIVSHDRYFLDRVSTRTLDLTFGALEDYPARYSRYLDLRSERQARRRQEYDEQQEFITRTEEFIRRYKAGQRSREARGRQTRLERLDRIAAPQEQQILNLRSQATLRSGKDVLTSTPLQAGYAGQKLVVTSELRIERGDRVAIIGPNGSGKSTLLKTLTGETPAIRGRASFGTNVKIGYYAQGHEGLPATGTPLSILLNAMPLGEELARTYLARFLFTGDDIFRPVESLSGGERSRLALACLLLQGANVLILDEPTNHLDIQTRETLEQMLGSFDGTVLFVSHDRFFIDRIATRTWAIEDGALSQYLGNFSDAQRQKARGTAAPPANERTAHVRIGRDGSSAKEAPRVPGAVSAIRLQKQLAESEREIARLEVQLNELSDAIAIASIDTDVAALDRLGTQYAKAHDQLEAAYQRWEEINHELESLLAATPS